MPLLLTNTSTFEAVSIAAGEVHKTNELLVSFAGTSCRAPNVQNTLSPPKFAPSTLTAVPPTREPKDGNIAVTSTSGMYR